MQHQLLIMQWKHLPSENRPTEAQSRSGTNEFLFLKKNKRKNSDCNNRDKVPVTYPQGCKHFGITSSKVKRERRRVSFLRFTAFFHCQHTTIDCIAQHRRIDDLLRRRDAALVVDLRTNLGRLCTNRLAADDVDDRVAQLPAMRCRLSAAKISGAKRVT